MNKNSQQGNYSNVAGISRVWNKSKSFLRPPEKLTPSQYSEKSIKIPIGNAISGYIRFANAPYQLEPINTFSDPDVRKVTLMWGAQTGKTQIINCALAYFIEQDPRSQIMMQPSEGDLRTWLETKFNPMVDANEGLKNVMADPRGRQGVNNQQIKSYAGGWLMFSWAGSPRTMRGRSAPVIYCDEVDGYSYNAEGHPVSLLWQRAATFGDQRKLMITSTPTVKNSSFVESSYQDGDMRQYYIPCPHCEEFITLKWSNVTWQKDENGEHLPETATYACQCCGGVISDGDKYAALKRGKWIAEKPFRGHASYHLSELYSSFRRWRDIVVSFLEKKATGDLRSFVNVSLAETWEEDGEKIDGMMLSERREPMPSLPDFALIVVAGVDVQDNRLEIQFNAIGRNDRMACFKHTVIYGDPSTTALWESLDTILNQKFETEDGRELHVRATGIDSGGHFTNQVYAYCKRNYGRRIFALKGRGGEGLPMVSRPTRNNIVKCPLFTVGVDTAKDTLFARLNINDEGAGYVHFSDELEDEFFLQLTAEKVVTRFQNGFKRRVYEKIRKRNEALDCMIYSLAAYAIIGININALADKLLADKATQPEEKEVEEVEVDTQQTIKSSKEPYKTKRKKRSFVPKTGKSFLNSWR